MSRSKRNCEECGKVTKPRDPEQKVCRSCLIKRNITNNTLIINKCIVCGNDFNSKAENRTHCTTCFKKAPWNRCSCGKFFKNAFNNSVQCTRCYYNKKQLELFYND
ncbi:hypothetical protein PV-S19_0356 [Pacmanvirus S19]|nr:hypothetical protein PV-S19_0356 [Pacmanvirus S19]